MAKSLSRIYDSITEELSKYHLTDDFPIPEMYIIDKIHDFRASLIRDAWKSKMLLTGYYQTQCCLQIECVEETCTINGIVVSPGIMYKIKLPQLVQDIGWDDILYLGNANFKKGWTRKNIDGFFNMEGNVYTSNNPVYTTIANDAFVKNFPTQGIQFLCATLLLYNPTTACNWEANTEYPVPSDIKLQMLVCQDILSKWNINPDKQNNADSSDTNPIQQKQSQNEK
jgi:hypothetical protein